MDAAANIHITAGIVSNCCLFLYLNVAGFCKGAGKMLLGSWNDDRLTAWVLEKNWKFLYRRVGTLESAEQTQ